MATRAIILAALVAFLLIGIVRADGTPTLAGSSIKTEDVALKCNAVFVGKITHVGPPTGAAPGLATFGVKVTVLQVLRGTVDAQVGIRIDDDVLNHESAPKVENTYVFFVEKDETRLTALKLLPATDDNIATVKKLIAQLPAK